MRDFSWNSYTALRDLSQNEGLATTSENTFKEPGFIEQSTAEVTHTFQSKGEA